MPVNRPQMARGARWPFRAIGYRPNAGGHPPARCVAWQACPVDPVPPRPHPTAPNPYSPYLPFPFLQASPFGTARAGPNAPNPEPRRERGLYFGNTVSLSRRPVTASIAIFNTVSQASCGRECSLADERRSEGIQRRFASLLQEVFEFPRYRHRLAM